MFRMATTTKACAAALMCVLALSTSGCIAEDDPESKIRALLATERHSKDILPANLSVEGLVMESSRQVGTSDDVHYFVAEYGADGVCLILVNQASAATSSSCGSDARGMLSITTQTGGARVLNSADDGVPSGWKKLGDFLIVNPKAGANG